MASVRNAPQLGDPCAADPDLRIPILARGGSSVSRVKGAGLTGNEPQRRLSSATRSLAPGSEEVIRLSEHDRHLPVLSFCRLAPII